MKKTIDIVLKAALSLILVSIIMAVVHVIAFVCFWTRRTPLAALLILRQHRRESAPLLTQTS